MAASADTPPMHKVFFLGYAFDVSELFITIVVSANIKYGHQYVLLKSFFIGCTIVISAEKAIKKVILNK